MKKESQYTVKKTKIHWQRFGTFCRRKTSDSFDRYDNKHPRKQAHSPFAVLFFFFSKTNERQIDKTRQDIYYHNITSTIFWHAVSKKTLVEACQINFITNQILYHIISYHIISYHIILYYTLNVRSQGKQLVLFSRES